MGYITEIENQRYQLLVQQVGRRCYFKTEVGVEAGTVDAVRRDGASIWVHWDDDTYCWMAAHRLLAGAA